MLFFNAPTLPLKIIRDWTIQSTNKNISKMKTKTFESDDYCLDVMDQTIIINKKLIIKILCEINDTYVRLTVFAPHKIDASVKQNIMTLLYEDFSTSEIVFVEDFRRWLLKGESNQPSPD